MSSNRRKTRALAPTAVAPPPMRVAGSTITPIMSHDHRYQLLVRYFTHHDRPADSPEQRAVALGSWLDAAVAAMPAAHPDDAIIANCGYAIESTHDSPNCSRHTRRQLWIRHRVNARQPEL